MTAKQKAQELLNKYIQISENSNEYTTYDYDKECSLIAVEFARQFITGDLSETFDKTMYLFDIKQEIEKL